MLKSMTGYGQGIIHFKNGIFDLSITSLNHRFSDIKLNGFEDFSNMEIEIKKMISKEIFRGYVVCRLKIQRDGNLDIKVLKRSKEMLLKIKKDLKIKGEIDLSLLFDNIKNIDVKIEKIEKENLLKILKKCLKDLDAFRKKEGKIIEIEIKNLLKQTKKALLKIEKRSKESVLKYEKRLKEKISKFLEEKDERILKEVAIFADKVDIQEEIVRLNSHIKGFDKLFLERSVGKKMNFLIQEMFREVNTIGSKSLDFYISKSVIDIKSFLEKIKEQAQNIQ